MLQAREALQKAAQSQEAKGLGGGFSWLRELHVLNSFWEELALVQAEAPGLVTGRGLCFFLAALLHSLLQAHFRLPGLQGTMVVDPAGAVAGSLPCWKQPSQGKACPQPVTSAVLESGRRNMSGGR